MLQKRELFVGKETTPGPGAYNSKSFIGEGPKRSMSAKTYRTIKHTPGPGEYNGDPLSVKRKSPNFSIPVRCKSSKQLEFEKNLFTPAPTAYSTKTSFDLKNSAIFGSAKRKSLCETERTPGPGQY